MTRAERFGIVFIIVMAVAVTFPGIAPINRIFPLVLGLPLVLFWVAAWVAFSALVFYLMHRSRQR